MMRTDLHHDERLALPIAENALLWCMRAWVVGLHRDIGAERRIEDVLARLGAPIAAEYLFGFMFALRHGAVRTIGVDCPCQPRVSADERTLLGVFALAQEDQSLEAMLALRGLVSAPAAKAAWTSAEGVAGALLRAGQLLTRPQATTARYAVLGRSAPAGVTMH